MFSEFIQFYQYLIYVYLKESKRITCTDLNSIWKQYYEHISKFVYK